MSSPRTLIVGIGSPHGDDQAGWQIANRLAADLDHDDFVVRRAASPAELLDWLDEFDGLIVCDACRGLGDVGEVRSWTWPTTELVDASWSGTHDLSLPAVLQLADRLGRLPQSVVIWSVEGKVGDAMATTSPEIAAALPSIIDKIANEVRRDQRCTNNHL